MITPPYPSTSFWARFAIALIATATALFFLSPAAPPGLTAFEELARDGLLRFHASHEEESRLTVIDIDESSIAALGPWPWPRNRIADLVEILLSNYGARAVALDMVFPDSAPSPEEDMRLDSLANHAPLSLAVALDFNQRSSPLAQGELPLLRQPLGTAAIEATGFIANHAGLSRAPCVGNIGFRPDPDGSLRHLPTLAGIRGIQFPPLAFSLLACSSPKNVRAEDLPSGYWRIPYRRALDSYTVIPAAAVLSQEAPRNLIGGRWILIGSSALGLSDRVATPLSPSTPGVLVHAQAASALLDADDGRPLSPWRGEFLTMAWSIVSIGLMLFMIPRLPILGGLGLLAALSLAWLTIVSAATGYGGYIPITPPLAAYLLILGTAVPYEWWLSQRESERLLDTFSHYVAPAVVAELMRQKPDKPLEPAIKNVTVLIADMESYTALTSTLSLDQAARLTQDFLDCLTRPVLEKGGTLDKYTGDGLVAFWGAPLPCPDQADQAIAAALEILDRVAQLNVARKSKGQAAVSVRIGIESGQALVGDLGTPFRSTYTAVGDCINFASKLQETARDLPVHLVIGPHTRSISTRHPLTALGTLPVKGAPQPIPLFTHEEARRHAPQEASATTSS